MDERMNERIELKPNIAGPIVLWIFAVLVAAPMLLPHIPMPIRAMFFLFSALLVFGGFVIIKRRLVLDADGVTASGLFGQKQVSWNAVDHYTFWSQDQTYMVAGGGQAGLVGILVVLLVRKAVRAHRARNGKLDPHDQFSMGALRLVTSDGKALKIDQRYRKPGFALSRAFDEVHARLRARTNPDFSPIQMGPGELVVGTKGSIAFADIEKVEATGPSLVVHKRGKRFAFSRTAMRKIKNSLLLIEMLGERGLIVNPSPGMFVPPTVLEKLRAATARQSAMPAARVVNR